MANRNNRTDGELDKLTTQDRAAVLNFNSRDAVISVQPKTSFDDLIVSLSSAYENKRARQVTEWESLRSRTLRHWDVASIRRCVVAAETSQKAGLR